MPAAYAHYRFGKEIIPTMPADVRGPVLRNRSLFDMGLQGPDFLFYHHFFRQTPLSSLGSTYHQSSGAAFFTRVCSLLHRHPCEASLAYVHGLLMHYCLDSHCHPLVYAMTDDTELGHSELESEFDRFLLTQDGCKKPHEFNMGRYMKLKNDEFDTVAAFFPEITGKDAAACIHNMALAHRLLTIPNVHGAIVKFTQFAGGKTSGRVMTIGANPKCDHLNQKLLALYHQALSHFPAYLEQLNAHLAYGEPFGTDFSVNFDRG